MNYNEDIYILHLSDLHIRNENKGNGPEVFYSTALRRLIEDISKQIENKENVIIVISGDVIDQGNYSKNKPAAIEFFQALRTHTDKKIRDIIIVPGNHDKCRDSVNSLICMSHSKLGIEPDKDESDREWKIQLEAYTSFIELVNEIYGIFELDKKFENTFGIETVKINSTNICFIRLDSAWCSHSENDHRKLRISKYQLSSLYNEYQSIRNSPESKKEPINLTIAISHHPLNWLTVDEEELCNSYFLSEEYLDVDILMCGHVHNFSAVNLFNHSHSLLTLVTGIGWGTTTPTEDRGLHRYSLYSLNLFYNSCNIIMRKTKSNGDFDFDYSVYAGEYELKDNKLRYPLKVKESNPFIRINAPSAIETKSLFVDNSLITILPLVAKSIALFSESMARLYERYKENFIAGVKEHLTSLSPEGSFDHQVFEQITDYLYEGKALSSEIKNKYLTVKSSFNDFLAYLNEICAYAVEELKPCFTSDVILRAHFRWHNFTAAKKGTVKQDTYCMLCQTSNLPDDQKSDHMQNIPWGGLIKPAFETQNPLVYSANKHYNSIDTTWDDFMTIVPKFNGYSHDVRIQKGVNESRPILTFGLSIKEVIHKNDTIALYLLAYLGFDKILAQIIDEYISLFSIDVRTFLPEIQRIRNKTNHEEHNNDKNY